MRDEDIPRVIDRLRYADAVHLRPASASRPPPEVVEARLREHKRRISAKCHMCGITIRGTVTCRRRTMFDSGRSCPLGR